MKDSQFSLAMSAKMKRHSKKHNSNSEDDRSASSSRPGCVQSNNSHMDELFQSSVEKCDFCDQFFNNKYSILVHNAEHIIIPLLKETYHQCPECLHHFETIEHLDAHTIDKHPHLERKPVPDLLESLVTKEPVIIVKNPIEINEVISTKEIIKESLLHSLVNRQPVTVLTKEVFGDFIEESVYEINDDDTDKSDTGISNLETESIKCEGYYKSKDLDINNPRIQEDNDELDTDKQLSNLSTCVTVKIERFDDNCINGINSIQNGSPENINEISNLDVWKKNSIILGNKPNVEAPVEKVFQCSRCDEEFGDSLQVVDIADYPSGEPLETPMHAKRRRVRSPTSYQAPGVASYQAKVAEGPPRPGVEDPKPSPVQEIALPQSPAIASSTPTRPRPRSRARVPIGDNDNSNILNYGSESESEDEDNQGVFAAPPLSRAEQVLAETPQDVQPDIVPLPADAEETYAPHSMFDFIWTDIPGDTSAASRQEQFTCTDAGPRTPSQDPYELFVSIWDRDIMEHICAETNRYAQQIAAQKILAGSLGPSSRICDWKDTTPDELYTYFAMIIAMGIVIKSKLEEYWQSGQTIFATPHFSSHMSLRRFQMLNNCLHFVNNEDMCQEELTPSEAKLFKIQKIIDHLNHVFQEMYVVDQNLVIDEFLLQWKGWLSINPFIMNKAANVGVKAYELCESRTGYLWRFEVHAHKSPAVKADASPLEASTPAIVIRLLSGLEHRGHTVWMDNFYNSPALARYLKCLGFDVVGTLRTNRQFVPQELTDLTITNMRPGQITGLTSGDVDVIVWRDQNRVATISTYHGNATATSQD